MDDKMNNSLEHKFMHGADYYPEQWLDRPDILEEDIRMMKLARINAVTLGVFAWAALEPQENEYHLEWLKEIADKLYDNGIHFFLATPSGARPRWVAEKYPSVLRVNDRRERLLYGMRMNHCYTSPDYRRCVKKIDGILAMHFGKHPGLAGWHISNEYHGECHCPLCQEAFRIFLKKKYGTLDKLNKAWWTAFWSKTYTDWEQIESFSPIGERAIMGLDLDWKRFVTEQTRSFMQMEIDAVRLYSPQIPVTTNMIGSFLEIDYPKLAGLLDIASIDIYPDWKSRDNVKTAFDAAFEYDVIRSLKRKPFLLMETTPSMTNWTKYCKPKGPGQHKNGCLQAVAHGADSVQYFQWRKSRGAFEKFHGAVVGHNGREDTRVFREVTEIGSILEGLEWIAGGEVCARAALIYDWNNRWALGGSIGPREDKNFEQAARDHYASLKRYGFMVDVIDEEQPLDGYRIVVIPMGYLIKPGFAGKLSAFVSDGGTVVMTYMTGAADENDLCFEGGMPGPLRGLAGIWTEELDSLYPEEKVRVQMLSCSKEGDCSDFCQIIHAESAVTKAVYRNAYYDGMPAVTCNEYGRGKVWFFGSRFDGRFQDMLYGEVTDDLINDSDEDESFVSLPLPEGVEYNIRKNREGYACLFFTNWGDEASEVALRIKPQENTGDDESMLLPPQTSRILIVNPQGNYTEARL